MAKSSEFVLLFFLICISSSLSFAYGKNATDPSKFIVVGRVYCDTCRVEFETKLSQPISGATVVLDCKNRIDGSYTYRSLLMLTDNNGYYKIEVEGNYEDSDCDVSLVKSPRPDCNEPTEVWRKARVVLTTDDGVSSEIRFANNLGFKMKEALPECKQVLTEMGYYELRDEVGNDKYFP
ncbi:Alg9-like mannosyltransferase family isoform 1 [Hibiscus syriacus]|uniref:Alg9-like mannosyltransferase family isoform 1 n=1 Tax=Hibiscus syriacus TaxID=106335 RepID=A0A6A3C6E3_HIBSY|nr:anther-specific protein LAT52-like [Hibiscus syriacus]KAE8723481.1 Alg9-like mannosyltransferase family isoform 1 [Hibiscus syriacus]